MMAILFWNLLYGHVLSVVVFGFAYVRRLAADAMGVGNWDHAWSLYLGCFVGVRLIVI